MNHGEYLGFYFKAICFHGCLLAQVCPLELETTQEAMESTIKRKLGADPM